MTRIPRCRCSLTSVNNALVNLATPLWVFRYCTPDVPRLASPDTQGKTRIHGGKPATPGMGGGTKLCWWPDRIVPIPVTCTGHLLSPLFIRCVRLLLLRLLLALPLQALTGPLYHHLMPSSRTSRVRQICSVNTTSYRRYV